MTVEEIFAGDRILLEFMRWVPVDVSKSCFVHQDTCERIFIPYYTDWNRVMPIIYKIEKLGFKCTIRGNGCSFESADKTIGPFTEPTKIEAALKAITAFIEWYNRKQKSEQ